MSPRGKNGVPAPPHGRKAGPRAAPPEGPAPLDVGATLSGRSVLVTGATGFVGKVVLTMLLDRYPEVGRVFVLVRPGTGGTAEARFFGKVAASRPFDPLRARLGDRFEPFLREKCVPLAGDVSDPLLGLSPADLSSLSGLDLLVNSAGLVDFDPSLELALGVNVEGTRQAVELCRRTGAGLLHVSTCYVAGNRDGVVYEDEEIVGYFPRREGVVGRPKEPTFHGEHFSVEGELADCARRIAEVRQRAEDRTLQSLFREQAMERLRTEGRGEGDEKAVRLAIGREKRLWISGELVRAGMERARHWGWPNTYTYTKSLGEQSIAASDVSWAIVRPSIVESALRFPFPGWNEGFTTSAPLTWMALRGHRSYPAAEKAILDVVPVDLVAAGILAAGAELLERRAASPGGTERPRGRVYHLASGDVNPLWVRRSIELTALYRRRFYRERDEGNPTWNRLLSRIEPFPVDRTRFELTSSPALSALARGARKLLREHGPSWGAPRVSAIAERLADGLDEVAADVEKAKAMWDLYMPFVWENKYVFRCASIREVRERLSPRDRQLLCWDPEALDWRRYWLDVHMQGMEEWVFPGFEEEADRKVHAPRQHRDLVELLEAACQRWPDRVALRMEGQRKERFTFRELRALSDRVAGFLRAEGVKRGDRVLLASENRPEWAIAYFGILRAGAAAVPVDPQLSEAELCNLWRSAGARLALVSEETAGRHPALGARAASQVPEALAVTLGQALASGGPAAPPERVAPEELASLIFTSGTTGTPKGVMLSHRNFASLVAKLSAVFDLGPGDGLLSVLPLHHTFEFTCGLLVPLSRGAEVSYLDELTADRIGESLRSGRVTALIGVPALWALLHRKITQELAARPGLVEATFQALQGVNARLRDSALGWNLGKLLFWPIHRRFGGRLRILVSGGSALDPEVQKAFREYGFDLFEGYGLTETSPVLAVSTPDGDVPPGSVGPALPGVELRIDGPDADGVGEVLARGPNVMLGYWREGEHAGVDPGLTGQVIQGGWLRTGDLGKLDARGNLTLVGRKKDVIIDANGKNVYPDEVEEAYQAPDLLKELCVVGLPDGTGEKVAMILVPDWRDRDRAEIRARIEAHVRDVSARLPFAKRVKVWHVLDGDLPKTATRKVKRPLVREELLRLEDAAEKGRRARESSRERDGDGWLLDLVAEVCRRPRGEVTADARLTDLGFDSLMLTELTAALEVAGVPASAADDLRGVHTVGELSRVVAASGHRAAAAERSAPAARSGEEETEIPVPEVVARLGRKVLGLGQEALYRRYHTTRVHGEANVPHDRAVLVVANHASHLDMGLVKVALGAEGERLAALAAKDYFFSTPVRRAYFENFTNLVPMEREGSLRASLASAGRALRRGYHLLIFPEGTRSRDGRMRPFFPTAGYLALHEGVDVLPVFLGGTHAVLPPGTHFLAMKPGELEVHIGPLLRVDDLRRRTTSLPRSEAYRVATAAMEEAVRALGARWLAASAPASVTAPPAAAPRGDGASGTPRGEPAAEGGGAPARTAGVSESSGEAGLRAAPPPGPGPEGA
jgi:long-chain acyl-CoA synthetase